MSTTIQRNPRPRVVTLAVVLLVIGLTSRAVYLFAGIYMGTPRVKFVIYLIPAMFLLIPYLVIWFIFLGKNWARLVYLIVFGLALCSLAANAKHLLSLPAREILFYAVQILFGAVSAGILLSSPAVDWFKQKKHDT